MSRIVTVAILHVRPGREAAARAAVEELVKQTHREPGCLGSALHIDMRDPLDFVLIERWASQEALDEHKQQPYVKDVLARGDDFLSAPPDIRPLTPVPLGDPTKGAL